MNNKDKKEARPFDGEHKTGFFEIIILGIFEVITMTFVFLQIYIFEIKI